MSITILDGGMGQELLARSNDVPTPLWATQVMLDHPGLVQDIHSSYFAAGADIATTNTYAAHRDRLDGTGLEDQFENLIQAALTEACNARDAHGSGLIAGSIGPLRASYRPDIHPPFEEAVEAYGEIAGLMAAQVDLIICETVASVDHARAIIAGAKRADKPIWLAVTVDDKDGARLRSGEPVADIVEVAADAEALLANCSVPEVIAPALAALKPSGKPIGAYANGFQSISQGFLGDKPTVDALSARKDLGPVEYADFTDVWIDLGASIIGGCCEVGPAHIAEINRRVRG